jgi:hypothetical protein
VALTGTGPHTAHNREVTKNKATLSTKMPRSAQGFIARVQQSRTAFDKGGFISPLFFNTKQPRGHKKIKPLFQQKSRDPHRASLCAYNKTVAVYLKPLAIAKVKLAIAKAARHC